MTEILRIMAKQSWHMSPVMFKLTFLNVFGCTDLCLSRFVSSEDICWSVWARPVWLLAAALFLLFWIRVGVSESFHSGTLQHLSVEQSSFILVSMCVCMRLLPIFLNIHDSLHFTLILFFFSFSFPLLHLSVLVNHSLKVHQSLSLIQLLQLLQVLQNLHL